MSAPEGGAAPPPRVERPALRLEDALAALIMAVLCVITLVNVLTRYFTNASFAFTEEVSVYLVVVMTFVGAAGAFARGHHLAITFLVDRLPARGRAVQRVFALGCGVVMFGVLVWWGGLMWWDDFQSGLTSPGLGVPQWWYTAAVPVLSALIVVRLLQRIARPGG
ncbi:TRAP transporter small permease [Xenophilus azovorans]|uniref:TRAP transporter small permease n=1 Tax=Xenophilus azovorans TaxID=151755 RepID=UPI00056F65F9|nr:TRAP transporter small permease [Xenophilus azovorans]